MRLTGQVWSWLGRQDDGLLIGLFNLGDEPAVDISSGGGPDSSCILLAELGRVCPEAFSNSRKTG